MMAPMLGGALNFVWLAICAFVLGWVISREVAGPHTASGQLARKLAAVLMFAVALFPAISDSDDIVCFALLTSHIGHDRSFGTAPAEDSQETGSVRLARAIQSLEDYSIGNSEMPAPVFLKTCILNDVTLVPTFHAVSASGGRAPPHTA